jgi:hypothetical protein
MTIIAPMVSMRKMIISVHDHIEGMLAARLRRDGGHVKELPAMLSGGCMLIELTEVEGVLAATLR